MPEQKKPFVLGITGTISSGKSAVGRLLQKRGIPVIDTDLVVHELFAEDEATKHAISDQFGAAVMEENGNGTRKVNRRKLGEIVFKDASLRKKLEAIVHPNVILACRRKVQILSAEPIVAILVPLLFEANLSGEYDEIWSVFTNEEILRKRLRERDKLSDAEIDHRLAAQLSQDEKARRANQVIDNSSSEAETERQVNLLLDKILSPKQ